MPHNTPMNGIVAYRAPRVMSAEIISRLRFTRSTSTPAKGPNRTDGSMRAIITPATANDAPDTDPPCRWTREATATNPTQSPSDDTAMAAMSLENAGRRKRSFSVAGLVPRRAATSSARLDTVPSRPGGASTRLVSYVGADPFPSGLAPVAAGSGSPDSEASGIEPTFTSTPSCTIEPHATHFALSRAWAVSRPPQCGQGSGSGIDHTAKSQSGYRLQE